MFACKNINMTKEEIQKNIYSLKNDNEIIDFVKRRIQELEDNSIESTVGQNYTKTFKEYISEKNITKQEINLLIMNVLIWFMMTHFNCFRV